MNPNQTRRVHGHFEQLKTEVKDEEVEKNIDSIRERFAILKELGENRQLKTEILS